MKNTILFFLLAAAVALGLSAFRAEIPLNDRPAEGDALVINLTSDASQDPHSSLMGLHLAQKALANGMEATVFLNVHGVKLMGEGAESIAFHGENLHELLEAILEEGGTILACPHCMEVHDLEKRDLMSGVEMAEDAAMMRTLKAGPTVFTY